jgi:putative oxidoreductase
MMGFGHGMSKVWGPGRFGPPSQLVEGVDHLGFPFPVLFAWCAALTEFLGALLLAAGLLTRPAALALSFNMFVAAFMAHRSDPFFAMQGPSKEPALLYLLPFLLFVFTGAGRFSADRLIRGK